MTHDHKTSAQRPPLASLCMLVLVALLLPLYGCSGGGGGGGGDDAFEETQSARDQRFADEAIERVLDRAIVSCELVDCVGDAQVEELVEATIGLVSTGCQYTCLPVAIDEREARFYWMIVGWRRAVNTCYMHDRFEVMLLTEVTHPCIPTE